MQRLISELENIRTMYPEMTRGFTLEHLMLDKPRWWWSPSDALTWQALKMRFVIAENSYKQGKLAFTSDETAVALLIYGYIFIGIPELITQAEKLSDQIKLDKLVESIEIRGL